MLFRFGHVEKRKHVRERYEARPAGPDCNSLPKLPLSQAASLPGPDAGLRYPLDRLQNSPKLSFNGRSI
jgi:hypothetical protein